MTRLYLETNYLVGCATGRDRLGLDRPPSFGSFDPAIPGVCFIEALRWMEGETKRRKEFGRTLTKEAGQLDRDRTSRPAGTMRNLLVHALAENDELLDDVSGRLFESIALVAGRAEIVDLSATVLEASRRIILIDKLADNLIAHCIIEHARTSPDAPKAFFSENHRDFGGPAVNSVFRGVGIRYFRDPDRLFGWDRAQTGDQTDYAG